jgi:hypothetical protein
MSGDTRRVVDFFVSVGVCHVDDANKQVDAAYRKNMATIDWP